MPLILSRYRLEPPDSRGGQSVMPRGGNSRRNRRRYLARRGHSLKGNDLDEPRLDRSIGSVGPVGNVSQTRWARVMLMQTTSCLSVRDSR